MALSPTQRPTSGLIAPLVEHKFRLDFGGLDKLTRQIQACNLDIINKRITIDIYENVDGDILPILLGILDIDRPFMVALEILAPNTGDAVRSLPIMGMKLIEHSFGLSYINPQGVAVHRCAFSFSDIKG